MKTLDILATAAGLTVGYFIFKKNSAVGFAENDYPIVNSIQELPYVKDLQQRLIYAKQYAPHKVAYYEELIKEWVDRADYSVGANFPVKEGKSYLLNYSGIEIIGKLEFKNLERSVYIFTIVDPFTKQVRKQSFIRMDIIREI